MTTHTRPPEINARIQRLVQAISAIPVAPNVADACSNISNAVRVAEKAESKPWKIDPLTAKEVKNYPDGSVRVPQIGHWLYIHSNGAFGILDLWSDTIVMSKAGSNGIAFYKPT
ncbi:hypothetical protein [Janthinobacterium sp. RB2R34]|uniref:hypothetical protein n=1 Tax=Janthinobacterium sp. RB2R34 TaxID=3424193 RepID=UPI003F23F607